MKKQRSSVKADGARRRGQRLTALVDSGSGVAGGNGVRERDSTKNT